MTDRLGWLLHPFLFAALPILYLYARNLAEVAFRVIVPPLLLSLDRKSVV